MTTRIRSDEAHAETDLSATAAAAIGSDVREAPAAALQAAPQPFVTASHELLFRPEEPTCDACDGPLDSSDSDEDGDSPGGHGLYLWLRHGEVVFEEPPLCGACAAAITISALLRWEIEEEEG